LYLAADREGRPFVPISEIARELNISFHFLTKVLQDLTEQELLTSSRGPSGGVALAVNPRKVTVKKVIEAIEGPDFFNGCILGFSQCNAHKPCALHDRWAYIKGQLSSMFDTESLESLGKRIVEGGLLLADASSPGK